MKTSSMEAENDHNNELYCPSQTYADSEDIALNFTDQFSEKKINTVDNNEIPEVPSLSSYECDLQHIDDLLKKYQMHDATNLSDEPLQEPIQGREDYRQDMYSLENEISDDQLQVATSCEHAEPYKEFNEGYEYVVTASNCQPDVVREKQLVVDVLEFHRSNMEETFSQEEFGPKQFPTETDPPANEEDINANTTKSIDHSVLTLNNVTYQSDNFNLWQHDFYEDSETFQIFQVPNTVDYNVPSEYLNNTSEELPQINQTDILPDPTGIPDEIKISTNNDCDTQIYTSYKVAEEPEPMQSRRPRRSRTERQVELYTRWYQNVKDLFVPLSCSYCKQI